MISDNQLISNRPKQLLDIEYYSELPKLPIEFDYSLLPEYLNMDLLTLTGIQPKTLDLVKNTQFEFHSQPSEKEIEYYRKRNTKFQVINVVANIHTFKKINDELVSAYPYSISLVAGPKRGVPDLCTIELLSRFNLAEISDSRKVFTDFSPFKPADTGFYADASFLAGMTHKHYTDTVGFVLETYFLPTDAELNQIPMPGRQDLDQSVINKFSNYRIKRYFKPFVDIKPRKIWGCDSPIELFLIQALAQMNLFPVIQTLIFRNGHIYDNFFEMVKSNIFIKEDNLITEADLYFPKSKLAIFCDSKEFHSGDRKIKDQAIDNALNDIGIKPLRLTGREIMDNLDDCVNRISDKM